MGGEIDADRNEETNESAHKHARRMGLSGRAPLRPVFILKLRTSKSRSHAKHMGLLSKDPQKQVHEATA